MEALTPVQFGDWVQHGSEGIPEKPRWNYLNSFKMCLHTPTKQNSPTRWVPAAVLSQKHEWIDGRKTQMYSNLHREHVLFLCPERVSEQKKNRKPLLLCVDNRSWNLISASAAGWKEHRVKAGMSCMWTDFTTRWWVWKWGPIETSTR